MEEQLRGLRRRRRPFEGVIPHNTHAVEEDLDKKITSFSTKIDILGKIMKVYGDDVNKIPSLFKEGFLSLRTEVENDYKDIITKSQQPPLTVLANFGETLTKSNIIQAEDTIAKRSTEKRGVNDVEPTLTIDLYDQDKAWF